MGTSLFVSVEEDREGERNRGRKKEREGRRVCTGLFVSVRAKERKKEKAYTDLFVYVYGGESKSKRETEGERN